MSLFARFMTDSELLEKSRAACSTRSSLKRRDPMARHISLWSLVALVAIGVGPSTLQAQRLAIVHVTLIDVISGRRVPNQSLVVSGDRITSVGPAANVRVPGDARVVDGRGKFLIPGLIDTHVHLALRSDRDSLRLLDALLAHGITSVRDAGAGGQDQWLLALRDRTQRSEILSPRLYVSGMVSGRNVARHGMTDAAALARQLIAWGVDGLKVRDGLTIDDVRAVVAEGARARVPVYGHTYNNVKPEVAVVYTREGQLVSEPPDTANQG